MNFSFITEIFASGIPEHFTEINFIEKLKQYGVSKIPQIIFFKDTNGLNRGCCKLIFATHEEALAFKDAVNYKDIKGKRIWLTWYLPEKNFKDPKYTKCNLFIKNIDSKVEPQELENLFKAIGEIFSLKINYDNKGKSKGYGYVCYADPLHSEQAAKKLNGHKLNDLPISVMEFLPAKDRHVEGAQPSKVTLFLKNIDKNWTDQNLKDSVVEHGEIMSTKVIKNNPNDAENRGIGFVTFKTQEAASKALAAFNAKFEELHIKAIYALSKEQIKQEMKDRNVFVKGLPLSIGEDDILTEMLKYGKISNVKIFVDEKDNPANHTKIKISRGYGFVCFEKPENAKAMIEELNNGKKVWGVNIYANLYETKQERKVKMIKENPYAYKRHHPKMLDQDMPRPWGMPMMPSMGHPFMPPFFMPPPYPPMMYPPQVEQNSGMSKDSLMKMDLPQLGELLYPLIDEKDKINASKITGMLLEMEKSSVVDLILNKKDLDKMIEEAKKVLNQKK